MMQQMAAPFMFKAAVYIFPGAVSEISMLKKMAALFILAMMPILQ